MTASVSLDDARESFTYHFCLVLDILICKSMNDDDAANVIMNEAHATSKFSESAFIAAQQTLTDHLLSVIEGESEKAGGKIYRTSMLFSLRKSFTNAVWYDSPGSVFNGSA